MYVDNQQHSNTAMPTTMDATSDTQDTTMLTTQDTTTPSMDSGKLKKDNNLASN